MAEQQSSANADSLFLSLVSMLATACWQQMGKMPSPVSGKVERELNHAKMTLDLLIMLRDKTKGNLSPDEEKAIQSTVSNLQLNYADELLKTDNQQTKN